VDELVDYLAFGMSKMLVGKLVYFPMHACWFSADQVEFVL